MSKVLLILLLPTLIWGQETSDLKTQHGARFTSFTMHTNNGLFGPYSGLKDYYAQAVGVEYLGKAKWKHWSLDVDLYSSLRIASNAFEKDQLTGKSSRYESGLFAVDAPEKLVLIVPSIFEITREFKSSSISFGHFGLNSTFLNMEHGRMIPSTFEGAHWDYKKGLVKINSAVINRISARSTSGFKSISQSLSQYNPGLDTSGSLHDKSRVEANLVLLMAGEVSKTLGPWYSVSTAEIIAVPNVFVTYVADEKLAHNQHLFQLQWIYQHRLANGGNDDATLAYFQQEASQYLGFKYSNKVGTVDYFSAASYIDGKGKLLFPREWGREDLVTFQGRERQEGMGKTLAVVAGAKGNWKQGKVNHHGGISTGIYVRPEPEDYKWNKYGMPSDQQTNLWWGQSWAGGKHTLNTLLVYKVPLGSQTISAGQTINKVDMVNVNLVYRFTLLPK
jgi:hypothetical protein